MNFFHVIQYFGLVWWFEKENIAAAQGLGGRAWAKPIVLVLFLGCVFAYGFWTENNSDRSELYVSIILAVTLLHFWYDGFIWSVRKKQV